MDELALEFDDTFNLAKAKVLEGMLSQEKLQALQPVDTKLVHMSEQGAELWAEEALRADPAWQELRAIARQAYLDFDL
ncbi:hypothetical protein ACIBQX_08670 [Nonomuraea sp. NPDC049714]|uniref:hypothetical protein n=1 Tax=Nonomuraea sp. NPDC049714 TaxID=3364357 RepID=UPI0037B6C2BC